VRKSLAPASTITLDELELEGSTNEAHFVRRRILGGARNRDVAYNPGNYRNDGLHLRASAVTAPSAGERRPAAPPANGLTLVWGSHVSGRGYLTDRAQLADTLRPRPYLEVNRADAERLGVETDQFAVLTAGGEKTKVAVKVTAGPAIGHVFLHSGVHGPLDPAGFTGPVSVELQPLAETAPNQGHALVGAGLGGETH
jgi:anaerobic selenocysteine-containing dehydrogenase